MKPNNMKPNSSDNNLRIQYYDRVKKLLGIDTDEKKIYVGIHHFSRDAIQVFNEDLEKGATKFVNYLIPHLITTIYPSLRSLTEEDKFDCTNASRVNQHKDCMKKANDCKQKGEVFSCKRS